MSTKTIETKICIIGAGPAGATTSISLSKMSVPHLIIDAAIFPRDKVCGDALDLKVIRVLNQLDSNFTAEILNDENFTKAWGASIIVSKAKKNNFHASANKSKYPFFMVSKRAYFDNYLVSKFNKAYADFRQGTRVKKLTRQENKWLIVAENECGDFHIIADMVVGADGDHSAVLRSLGERKINRKHYAGALRQYWKGISDINPNNYLEVYLPKTLPLAYLWIFPLANGEANVGCGLVSDLITKKSVDLKKLFIQLIKDDPALAHRFRNATPLEKPVGWGLPFASQRKKVYGDGYLLAGDAASLISPLTGEGVGPAMMSGFIASKFIERALENNLFDEGMFKNYDREIYKRLQSEVRNYNLLRKVSPALYNVFINVFSSLALARYYFNRSAPTWSITATKPIEVDMN